MTSAALLEGELLAHLDTQIASSRRLLGLVLAQGAAIRARDVEGVLARLGEIQTEMGRRSALEQARMRLLVAAGQALGLPPAQVTLEALCRLVTPAGGAAAQERSAGLRGLLAEIAREHGINRALMRQELTFLSHLVRLVGNEPEGGYAPPAGTPAAQSQPSSAPSAYRVLDLQA
jgi:FlgN protein